MNMHILEKVQIIGGITPINLAAGAQAGDWVSLKDYQRCAVVFFKGVGTAGQDPTITLEQATNVAGAGAKALTFTRIDAKQGALLTAIGQYTTINQAAANTYTHTDAGEAQAIWVIDIDASELDSDNGFDCIRASISDVGTNSQIGGLLYLGHDGRYGNMPSALTDI